VKTPTRARIDPALKAICVGAASTWPDPFLVSWIAAAIDPTQRRIWHSAAACGRE
jgi:hypothetical protein